ncbi:MAG: dihydrodipicolinate reductase [Dehalococcoidia bacterium]|nr:dihydrodipicolinate reductase [Dehalococcoidia bacterium]
MVRLARRHGEPEAAAVSGKQEARSTERRRLRTAHYGLGEVGRQVVALLVRRPDVQIVAALDADPLKVGRDIGEVAGLGYGLGVTVSCDPELLVSGVNADVVIHATSPHLSVTSPQLLPLLASGKSVISACDELVYPWTSHPEMASRLDAAAKEAGVALLAVGASTGFVADSLPLFFASACAEVEALSVTRVIDLANEPSAVWATAGVGMTLDAFRQAADEGAVGLPALLDSVALMAASLGWRLDKLEETIEPIQATRPWETEAMIVARGRVAGLRQVACGHRNNTETLSVDLIAFLGAPDPHDAIGIRGRPPISARIEGGIPSHLASAALMVHALPALATAPPGLLSVTDLLGTYPRQ